MNLPSSARNWKTRLALFAMIVGPGIITANVDNDAGGIATYSVAGASYGYKTLWIMLPTCLLLVLVQEMCSRMGVVTGKGLSALIRERFGLRVSFYLMLALIITNIGNSIANLAGVAASGELFGIPRWILVPAGAFVLWRMVIKGNYQSMERVFLFACTVYITYVISGVMAKPDWGLAARSTVVPTVEWNVGYFSVLVGLIGTTIAPWMQFYQQASVVEKGIPLKHYRYSQFDTLLGAVVVTTVAVFIIIACAATLHREGISVVTADDAARALMPIAGTYSGWLFGFGLLTASFFGATILPISTATSVCEALGWESGVDHKFTEAPQYYLIYSVVVVIGATVALAAERKNLINIMLISQVINGVLLPVVLYFMLRITNDPTIMGEYKNNRLFNILSWSGGVVVALMSLTMVALTFLPR